MIHVYSFEEWDALQDPNRIVEWGGTSSSRGTDLVDYGCPYKDAPLEIRQMFYSEYVHTKTNPTKKS